MTQGPGQSAPPVAFRGSSRPGGKRKLLWGWAIVVGVVTLTFLIALAILSFQVGFFAAVIAGLAALLPLSLVLGALVWVDRWEPEPKILLGFSFLWGAGSSIVLVLVTVTTTSTIWLGLGGDPTVYQKIAAVIQAPVVEESAKALGLVMLYLFARKYFDGPVDGIVFGGFIAAGFAFTENIQYFGSAINSANAVGDPTIFLQSFFGRGILTPFAHALFTVCTGIALGLAALRRSALASIGLFLMGLALAMIGHSLFNSTATILGARGGIAYYIGYAVIMVPIFVAMVVIVLYLRRRERIVLSDRLTEYGRAGWFAPREVEMLVSLRRRRQAVRWAARFGPMTKLAMRDFQVDATHLAYQRNRMFLGRARADARAEENRLLIDVADARRKVAAGVVTH